PVIFARRPVPRALQGVFRDDVRKNADGKGGAMTYDLVLRGGTIVDGTGRERFAGDVAIRGGRVVEIGKVQGRGARELDVSGLIVAPGVVDLHAHYDAQLHWDPYCTASG